MIKVAVIGLGIGRKHVEAYLRHPSCEVVSLCDLSQSKLQEMSDLCPGARLTTDAAEIVHDDTLDIVSVASYDNYHAEQILGCIHAGKHVLAEKPLCLTRDEAEAIKDALDESPGVRLSSNLNLRTCPRFHVLRHAVQSGRLGKLFYAEGDYLWGRVGKLTEGWRKDIPFYSIILGAAVHMIDLVLWFTGERPCRVYAVGNQIATEYSALRFNDFSVLVMEFAGGFTAKISASGGCVHPHFHAVRVFGTAGTFTHDLSGAMWINTPDPNVKPEPDTEAYPARDEKHRLISSFVDAILDGSRQPLVSEKDVFDTMSVCFAAEQSMREGKNVKIEYIE